MLPTSRMIRLIAIGSPLWLAWALVSIGWIAPVLYLLLLALVALSEAFLLPPKSRFSLERSLPRRFSFDASSRVRLRLANHSERRLNFELLDSPPDALQGDDRARSFQLRGGHAVDLHWKVLPVVRGAHAYGPVHLRWRLGLGLVMRRAVIPLESVAKIYPRFSGVDRFDLTARIDMKEEATRMARLWRGAGLNFESLRPYAAGEDLRYVDWKASAKRGKLISKNLQVEKGQHISVLIDAGRLMGEPVGKYARIEYALNAAVMLAHVAGTRGDYYAAASFSNRVEALMAPVKGGEIMPRTLETLYRVQARSVESDYWNVMTQMMSRLRKRSLMIMMTDVLDAAGSSGLVMNLARAARRHLVLCVVFTDPGAWRVADSVPESGEAAYRKVAAAYLTGRRELALREMRAKGITVLESAPETFSIQLVRKYLELRRVT